MRTPEDKAMDNYRRIHEDDEEDCIEECPFCQEEAEEAKDKFKDWLDKE